MSREIKFRAWSIARLEMIDISETTNKATMVWWPQLRACEYDRNGKQITIPLMQYTGLKDKNGVPICQGDIVKTTALSNDHHQRGATDVLIVKEFMGNTCICFSGCDTGIPLYPFNVSHCIEVIGNIYEHKHLLENGHDE